MIKLLKSATKIVTNSNIVASIFPLLMIVPNILLDITENMCILGKIVNILVPLSIYYLMMTCRRNAGATMLWLTVFMVMNGFQIVVLYLFGESIIAVDMLLNCITTNTSEVGELLTNLAFPIILSAVLYIPLMIWGLYASITHQHTTQPFRSKVRRSGLVGLASGIILTIIAMLTSAHYSPARDLYPFNIISNIVTALQRTSQSINYHDTSADFTYAAVDGHENNENELYVLIIGETSRADNWELFGYNRQTNPRLSVRNDLVKFPRAVSQSNTTHKCVPMMLTHTTPETFDSIMYCKSVVTAFKESGYYTAFFSNQAKNHSYTQYFSEEADTCQYLKSHEHYDMNLVALLKGQLEAYPDEKELIVLHTYGSHFNYNDRYTSEYSYFKPDDASQANMKNRAQLLNAYDNAIRYTDAVVADVIEAVEATGRKAVVIYTSDHGEDIFDDDRERFLHASPIPTYYQLHVPLFVWTSDSYDAAYPEIENALQRNALQYVAPSQTMFHTLLQVAGIETRYFDTTQSIASQAYSAPRPAYLSDLNEWQPLEECGIKPQDIKLFQELGVLPATIEE